MRVVPATPENINNREFVWSTSACACVRRRDWGVKMSTNNFALPDVILTKSNGNYSYPFVFPYHCRWLFFITEAKVVLTIKDNILSKNFGISE